MLTFVFFSLSVPDFKYIGERNALTKKFRTCKYSLTVDYVSLDEFMSKNQKFIVKIIEQNEYSRAQIVFKLTWSRVDEDGSLTPRVTYINTPVFYRQENVNLVIEALRNKFHTHVDKNNLDGSGFLLTKIEEFVYEFINSLL